MHYQFKMSHDYKTRAKTDTEQDGLAQFRQNIIKNISELKYEVLNLRDIVIKNLQQDNTRLHAKSNYVEKKFVLLET